MKKIFYIAYSVYSPDAKASLTYYYNSDPLEDEVSWTLSNLAANRYDSEETAMRIAAEQIFSKPHYSHWAIEIVPAYVLPKYQMPFRGDVGVKKFINWENYTKPPVLKKADGDEK